MPISAQSIANPVTKPTGRRIRFVVAETRVMREFGEAMVDVARAAGHQAFLHHGPDADLADADQVVITGTCLKMAGLWDSLQRNDGPRPEIIVWQTESLPPPAMSSLGETTGRRVLRCNWSNLPRWARRSLEPVIPFRTRLIRAVWWWMARPYRRELAAAPNGQGWGGFEIHRFRESMAELVALRNALDAESVDRVVASTASRVELLKRLGIPAILCPVGYHPGCGRDHQGERDIDILFFGVIMRNRRGRLLRRLQHDLAAKGRNLHIVRGPCYGDDRERLLNRSRIVLNLPRMPWDFPAMRLYMAMGCGALVVSEAGADPAPFAPDEHLVMTSTDRLLDRMLYFLGHEEERQQIAERGRRFVVEELNMSRQLATLLDTSAATCTGAAQ